MSTSGEPRSRLRLLFAVSLLALALFIGMRADDTLAGFTVGRLPQTGAPVLPGQPVSSGTGRQAPFDCSQIKALGIDRQTNIRAAQIMRECSGQARSSEPRLPFPLTPFKNVFSPLDLGSGDVDIITDPEDWPYVTQSESSVWSKGDEHIVVAYNDSSDTRNGNFSGISYSMDGGNRFELIHPFNSDHTYNLGNPMVVFNQALNTGQGKWFAGDLVSDSSGGCGGQGIGMWSSLDSITWTLAPCAHSSFNDDRPSMWVDNNSSSFYYGRMYVSFNNFTILNSLQVVYSDNGTVWHSAVTLSNSGYRNMQITGGPDGAVYVTAMDENGGGLNPRTHHIYKSTNGGVNWTHSTIVSGVAAPGNALCQSNNYFPIITPIWRYMGWGQAGVGPSGVIHYAYGAHGLLGDEGDIYYVRSTDNGSTWSNPIRLNADVTLREQWMPSLSVNSLGAVTVGWYDRRNTTDGENYEYRAIVSTNNGLDWGDDEAVSDGLIPQPEQPDPNFPDCYAGDFNRHFATDNNAFLTWTDGRVLGGGRSQQDIFFDKIAVSSPTPTYTPTGTPPTATPTPTCGSSPHYIISELHNVPMANGSSLVAGSRCDECTVDISLPFSHALYCNTFAVAHIGSNGTIGFVSSNNPYSNVCLPHNAFDHVIAAHWDDLDMSPSA